MSEILPAQPIAMYSTGCYGHKRRVFRIRTFSRWVSNIGVSDDALCETVREMVAGLINVDLGGSVLKKRLPLAGRGKRGGARVLIATNGKDRWFFIYGFGKKERASIDHRELAALRKLAQSLLKLEPWQLTLALTRGELTEICHEQAPYTG